MYAGLCMTDIHYEIGLILNWILNYDCCMSWESPGTIVTHTNVQNHLLPTFTRGSPRSLLFRNFSCRLLSVSFPSGSSAGAAGEDLPKTIGDIKLFQILTAAYTGI
jgi:hypothetical protein